MYLPTLRVLAVAAAVLTAAFAQQGEKRDLPESRVKSSTRGMSGERHLKGVVDKINDDCLTLVEVDQKTGEVHEHQFTPNDVLRNGDVMEGSTGRFTYRWQDVKRGDTVHLVVNQDRIDKVTYCIEICIWKRPKGKLPECQKPKEYENFPQFSMLNDLDNGEDVSDEEIKKLFPPTPERKDDSGRVIARAYPGGLPKEYQKKLDEIRAKKEKATPPEKKDDKR